MIEPTLHDAVKALVGGILSFNGTFESIIYHDDQTPPTKKQAEDKLAELQAEYDANQYQRSRALEYPSIPDQLDEIYHNGIDSWKAVIKVTKDKHPKG